MIVSVVVIAFNEQQNIAVAVTAVLAQTTAHDLEVIIVNDGSTDDTLPIARSIAHTDSRVHVIDLGTNKGRGAARAAGVAAATGAYIAFVDSDIVLPPHWLETCLQYIGDSAACGGTAVPDGDVTWTHRAFALTPKVVNHTVAVTGSNGLFRRDVFDNVYFDITQRQGEDVALNRDMTRAGLATTTIPGLIVEHHEHKTYAQTATWLFVSGIGASRQLKASRKLRTPDLAFLGLLTVAAGAAASPVLGLGWIGAAGPPAFLLAAAAGHIRGKFHVAQTPLRASAATVAHAGLLATYFAGRAAGLLPSRHRRRPAQRPANRQGYAKAMRIAKLGDSRPSEPTSE